MSFGMNVACPCPILKFNSMKRTTFISISFFLFVHFSYAQEIPSTVIQSEIASAIVYLDGAEVSRTKVVQLRKGKNELIFSGLSPKLNNKTIQINAPQGVDILSISSKTDYLALDRGNHRINVLRDSLELVKRIVVELNDEKLAYGLEKEMLLTNKSLGGTANGVAISDLKVAADYYRNRMWEINKRTSLLDRQLSAHQKSINNISRQLNELNSNNTIQRSEVSILVLATADMKVPIVLSYLVTEVGWIPTYDIKAKEINEPITLVYRAKVYNNSDISWDNIKLTLSSADPNISAAKPVLSPWFLSYRQSAAPLNAYSQGGQGTSPSLKPTFEMGLSEDKEAKRLPPSDLNTFQKGNLLFTTIAVSDINVEFKIKDKFSIPSDAKPYFIEIKTYELSATFKHFTIPKQSCDAYLLARITGWEDLDILEGAANIYLNGTFTGQSFINTRNINDTLDISLGRDNKVQVHRKRQVEFNKEKSMGANKKELFAYQIVIKNNHKVPVEIEVLDQIPVPQDSDIEVADLDLADARRNELNGELKWNLNLEPTKTETIDFSFSIKYPKNRPVNTKQNRFRSVRYL
jgi:uncharacterized protein (TIGR02231 family)